MSQCKKTKRTAKVDGLETRRCQDIEGIEASDKQTLLVWSRVDRDEVDPSMHTLKN